GTTWSSLDQRDGVAGRLVLGIAEDGEGAIWLATDQGITRYTPGKTPPRVPTLTLDSNGTPADPPQTLHIPRRQEVTFSCSAVDTKTDARNRWFRFQMLPGALRPDEAAAKPVYWRATRETEYSQVLDRAGTYTFALEYVDRDLNVSPAAVAVIAVS